MLFSVIIPSYNRKEKVLACLNSLYKQDFPKKEYEIIVVDVASLDGTSKRLQKENITLLRTEKRIGPGTARNYGVSKAKGKYLVFTDSDCLVPKNWLSSIFDGYKKYPNVISVGGSYENLSKSIFAKYESFVFKKYIRSLKPYISTKRDEMPFVTGNISYLKETFQKLNGFREGLPLCVSGDDNDLKERALKKNMKFLYIPVNIIHNHSFSLRDFYSQSLNRGANMLLDSRKRGKTQTKAWILLRFLVIPIYPFIALFNMRGDIRLALVDTLFFVFRNLGKLKHYDDVLSIKL